MISAVSMTARIHQRRGSGEVVVEGDSDMVRSSVIGG
jgi:hypothetical protein